MRAEAAPGRSARNLHEREEHMKKRILSMLLALIMALSLVPVTAFAAATLEGYFDGLPVIAETEPGAPGSTNKWKVTTLDGEDVLISGNAGKSSSSR